ncbi:MAG TPA: thiamine pyrophosphate-dependent enzyme [Burkholderiales bacterium]|nr:thiamine pyrophosphate-dependent enzyme [Burkholderiales bacterium]
MTGAESLLRALRAMGVARIYASPGSDWAPVWEALAGAKPGEVPEYVSVRHEETAVAMANGYAKASAKLPAVVLHTTVGTLHAAMALRIALHERVPMVVLAGESVAFAEDGAPLGRQWLRLLTDIGGPARLIEPCVKSSFPLMASQLLARTIQRACQLALSSPRGPVFLSVPIEHLLNDVPMEVSTASLPAPPAPDLAALDALARELAAARSPIIITEEAGRDRSAVDALVELAETLGAPVFDAWQPYYLNFPRKHPLYGGVVSDAVPECDAVLLVDAVLPWHPPSAVKNVKVFVLGEDPLRSRLPYWGFRTDAVIPGDVRTSLIGLAARLGKKNSSRSNSSWRAKREAERDALRAAARAAGAEPHIATAWVAHELNEVLPRDAVLVDETITHRLDLLRLVERLGPGGFYEASFGGLGVGLGVALGVKQADPGRTVVCTIGDGAFHYNPVPASLGAAQEHRLPIFVILFNNAGYLSQKADVAKYYPHGQAVKTGRFAGTSIVPPPDYAALARAYGGVGERVEAPGEVRAALQRGFDAVAQGRLALLDVLLKPV